MQVLTALTMNNYAFGKLHNLLWQGNTGTNNSQKPICLYYVGSDSSVDTATCYIAGFRFPGRDRELSLLHSVQTGYKAHRDLYLLGTGTHFPEVRRQEREAK